MDYLAEDILRQLKITEVSDLISHEEIIPTNLLKLKEAMLNIGQLVDPLIVDSKSKIVLDGNHRVKVLETIKCPRTVCQMVDYTNENIRVGAWFPASEKLSLEMLRGAGFKCEAIEFDAGLDEINNKKSPFMFVKKIHGVKKAFLVNSSDYSLDSMIEEQKSIMDKLDSNNFRYVSDEEAGEVVDDGKGVLYKKAYTKQEIIARAHSKRHFPPKSTRHVIPNRIIRINMRLGWLHEGQKEATEYLERMLHERVYNGNVRRYLEPVIVIY